MQDLKPGPGPSHPVSSKEEWLRARKKLLEAEKELTRQSDAIARQRQDLPWVRVDKDYRFDSSEGQQTLAGLFQGRSQLIIYHFMFGPDYDAGCPSCSAIADGFNGIIPHLANHDVAFWAVSRAPLEKLLGFELKMGWTFPWASSANSEFNFDFGTSFTVQQQQDGIEYNYQKEPPAPEDRKTSPEIPTRNTPEGPGVAAAQTGTDVATYARERPGMSVFVIENGLVYHTYSAYSRGLDAAWGMYPWLDRAPRGRNEQDYWLKRHDEYNKTSKTNEDPKSCCH